MPQQHPISELIADVKEQIIYLNELGIDSFDISLPAAPTAAANAPASAAKAAVKPAEAKVERAPASDIPDLPKRPAAGAAKPRSGSRIKALPTLAERKLPTAKPVASSIMKEESSAPMLITESKADPALQRTDESIEDIRLDIGNCTRCPLSQGRTQIVHTTGNMQADLMFVGEAPGADEDAQGVPFVGRAGKLLTQIIEAIGFSRDEVAIGNINRCRPPGNRQPTLPEAHTCRPFLMREIAVIKPKVIVVLGNTAMHNLLDTKIGITKMRGQFHDYFDVKVMPTFHPAYLLRDPHKKREVWEDMKMVRAYLALKTDP